MTDVPSKKDAARRRGSLFGILLFAVIVTTFTAVCSVEIILQAWAEAPRAPGAPGGSSPGAEPLLPQRR